MRPEDLKRIREKAGETQAVFARTLGYASHVPINWAERGTRGPTVPVPMVRRIKRDVRYSAIAAKLRISLAE